MEALSTQVNPGTTQQLSLHGAKHHTRNVTLSSSFLRAPFALHILVPTDTLPRLQKGSFGELGDPQSTEPLLSHVLAKANLPLGQEVPAPHLWAPSWALLPLPSA